MKNGVNYFPLDVHLDNKFKLLEAEFGYKAFAVIIKLFQKIYGEEGYFCYWDSEVLLLFSHEIGLGCNCVSEIIEKAVLRGIFNKDLYEKYNILTSRGIQERYFTIVKRRKSVEVESKYLLIKGTQIYQDVCKIDKNVYKNDENVYEEEQRKEKESKEKRSKENIYKKCSFVKPTIKEVEEYCYIERKNNINPLQFYNFYESKNWYVGKNKMTDWKASIRLWEQNQKNNKKSKSTKETIQADIDYEYYDEKDIIKMMQQ